MQPDDPPPIPSPGPPATSARVGPGQPPHAGPWHHRPRFEVIGIERAHSPHRGPQFGADSPTALIVLSGIIGPTAVLTLRTLAMVARTGSTTWHIADLAALSGVKSGIMRHTLDRLHQFGWLNMDTSDQVGVYLNGSLSQRQIARLHPTVADHYLGRSRSQTPTSTATSPVIGNHHASTGPSSQLAPRSSEETPTIDDRGTAHHIVHRWVSPPALDSSRPQPARAATPDTGPTPGAARRPELDL